MVSGDWVADSGDVGAGFVLFCVVLSEAAETGEAEETEEDEKVEGRRDLISGCMWFVREVLLGPRCGGMSMYMCYLRGLWAGLGSFGVLWSQYTHNAFERGVVRGVVRGVGKGCA